MRGILIRAACNMKKWRFEVLKHRFLSCICHEREFLLFEDTHSFWDGSLIITCVRDGRSVFVTHVITTALKILLKSAATFFEHITGDTSD